MSGLHSPDLCATLGPGCTKLVVSLLVLRPIFKKNLLLCLKTRLGDLKHSLFRGRVIWP